MVLQSIRDRLTGILAFLVLGILVIPFAFVGVNSYFGGAPANVVAVVNDAEITSDVYNQTFQDYRRNLQAQQGAAFDPEALDQPIVRRQHLDRLIDQELMRQAAEDIGLSVDDERLAQRIRDIPAFQVDGEFNTELYQSRLALFQQSPRQFENEIRREMILTQVPMSLLSSSFATPSEQQRAVALVEEQRTFDAAMFFPSGDDFPAEIPDEDVQAWFAEHQEAFRATEQVTIEYLELDAQQLPAPVAPDEELLRERFEAQKGRFINPEQRLASHILISVPADADESTVETARQQAADLAERARAGEDFATLAEEFSEDQGSAALGGDLGWVESGFMVKAFEDGLYALSDSAPISDPVKTGFGWHVIQLREIRPAEGMGFEEARSIVAQEYIAEERERAYLEQADRLVDIVYEDPTTLSAAAEALDLEVQTAGPFDRSGGDGIAAIPEVVRAAFSDLVLGQRSVSEPVNLGDNHIVMLRVAEHQPTALQPLEEVREEVEAQMASEIALERTRERAQAVADQVRAGTPLADAFAGEQVLSAEGVTRYAADPSADLAEAAFELPLPNGNEPVVQVAGADGGFAVIVLRDVTPGTIPEGALLAEQQVQRRVANAAASIEQRALIAQLRETADIEVFEDRL